jgi:hypothetical protein
LTKILTSAESWLTWAKSVIVSVNRPSNIRGGAVGTSA